jgi:enoyl-CoA hydratase
LRRPAIAAIVVTGSPFAGADIKEIRDKTFAGVFDGFRHLVEGIARVRKPTIAAVAGHAVGGGCGSR